MTTNTTIKVFSAKNERQGFTFQKGFAALVDENGRILAATSGWDYEDALYVYRPTPEGEWWGEWVGDWESEDTFPVEEVLCAISNYERREQIEKEIMKMTYNEMAEVLITQGIATEEEIVLISNINGYATETMEDILYAREGLRSFDQLGLDEY